MMLLQGLMDDARAIVIPETGERVALAPGTRIVLADNTSGTGDTSGQYTDTAPLNRATLDRLAVTVRIGYLDAARETQALAARSRCAPELATLLVAYATQTRRQAESGALTHGIGLRRLVALAELLSDGLPLADAIRACIIDTAPPADHEALSALSLSALDAAEIARLTGAAGAGTLVAAARPGASTAS
jgi:MoxR-like ATPase